MAQDIRTKEDIQTELGKARREYIFALEAKEEDIAYEWKQEIGVLAKELEEATIERPFTAYEEEYGDYPI
jgi:hypothetical protein